MNLSIAGNPKLREKNILSPPSHQNTSNFQQKLLRVWKQKGHLTNPSIFRAALAREIPNLAKRGTKKIAFREQKLPFQGQHPGRSSKIDPRPWERFPTQMFCRDTSRKTPGWETPGDDGDPPGDESAGALLRSPNTSAEPRKTGLS